uniref:U6 snRNA phosphodiesterase n=1 Tax=Ciona intestinalis TaxID=7719 RepID=F6WVC9_CIOIN|nr:U6 snRNA phosphodiesterase-like [Ciona intestinalis]|eukprot:XP_002131286.1 U6 snRNA phosphodiesterase-like [Ciona intestinalis]
MNSLEMLGEYSSSSDEESISISKTNTASSQKSKLVVPDAICALYATEQTEHNDPTKHQGRVRSFQHVKGNWATFLYIPYPNPHCNELRSYVEDLLQFQGLDHWKIVDDFHLSVSRTSAIPHHFIEPLVEGIQGCAQKLSPVILNFSCDLKFYVNDEKTRSFCGFEVTSPFILAKLQTLVDHINKPLKDYKCDSYYENPSFHISISWTLGNIFEQNWKKQLEIFQTHWSEVFIESPELFSFEANNLVCKCGNRLFTFEISYKS